MLFWKLCFCLILFEKFYKKQKIVENYVDISMYTSQIQQKLTFFASGILELAFKKITI